MLLVTIVLVSPIGAQENVVPLREEIDRKVEIISTPEKEVELDRRKGKPVKVIVKLQREGEHKNVVVAIHAYKDDIVKEVVEANLRGWEWANCDYTKIYFGKENVASRSIRYLLDKSPNPDLTITCKN